MCWCSCYWYLFAGNKTKFTYTLHSLSHIYHTYVKMFQKGATTRKIWGSQQKKSILSSQKLPLFHIRLSYILLCDFHKWNLLKNVQIIPNFNTAKSQSDIYSITLLSDIYYKMSKSQKEVYSYLEEVINQKKN